MAITTNSSISVKPFLFTAMFVLLQTSAIPVAHVAANTRLTRHVHMAHVMHILTVASDPLGLRQNRTPGFRLAYRHAR